MNEAFLSLGGNLGNRMVALNAAQMHIEKMCGKIVSRSQLYETEAWGYASDNLFLNQAIKIKTRLNCRQLLDLLKIIEKKVGRKANQTGSDDRTIDIDILFFNTDFIYEEDLKVPHPYLHRRRFVLEPLNEIAPGFVHPVMEKKVSALKNECSDDLKCEPYTNYKLPYICIEGNIGAGKTTLAVELAKKLNALFVAEKFEENKWLTKFYSNQKKYALELEKSFLTERYKQLKQIDQHTGTFTVSDFSIYRSACFASVTLSSKEYTALKKQLNEYHKQLRKPDLIVYLKSPASKLKENITKRGRPYEQGITKQYLFEVNEAYNKQMALLKDIPVVEVYVKKWGKVEVARWMKMVEKHIKKL